MPAIVPPPMNRTGQRVHGDTTANGTAALASIAVTEQAINVNRRP